MKPQRGYPLPIPLMKKIIRRWDDVKFLPPTALTGLIRWHNSDNVVSAQQSDLPAGDFTSSFGGYSPYVNGGTATNPILTLDAGELKVDLMGTYVQSGFTTGVRMIAGAVYTLSFDLRGLNPSVMNIYLGAGSMNLDIPGIPVTTTKTRFTQIFTATTTSNGSIFLRTSDPMSTNPTLWFDNVSLTVATVSQLTDLSGGNNHLTQSSPSLRPKLVSLTSASRPLLNNQKAIVFEGSMTSTLALNAEHTHFFVYSGRTGDQGSLYSTSGFNKPIQRNSNFWANENLVSGGLTGNFNASNLAVFTMDYTAGTYKVHLNNVLQPALVIASALPTGNFVVGIRAGDGNLSAGIYEIISYSRILTDFERQQVYGWLKNKYNLA